MKIHPYRGEDGEFRWRIRDGRNGKILADSAEGYRRRVDRDRIVGRFVGLGVELGEDETVS